MSLATILTAVTAAGTAELAQLQRETELHIHKIMADAEQKARRQKSEVLRQVKEPGFAERARRLQQAKLAAEKIKAVARADLVNQIFSSVQQRLTNLRQEPSYATVLRRLTAEAIQALGAEEMTDSPHLLCDPRDKELLQQILSELELSGSVTVAGESWGGVIVQSQDGRITVNNTLESRLERAAPYLRSSVFGR